MRADARQETLLSLEEIVAKDPASVLYLPYAERLTEQGRVEEAVRLCEERRNRPGHGIGDLIVLARAYLADGRLAEARAGFEAALELDRENVVALKALGGILSHVGDHEEAAGYYRAVCRVDPGDLEAQTALHQITSGEFAEVRPADVIVGQGGLTWQPVRLPREEDHLPELALGLKTIAEFEERARPGAGAARGLESMGPLELEPAALHAAERAREREAPVEELPPVPVPVPVPGALVEGNRNAFQTWLKQLSGRDSEEEA